VLVAPPPQPVRGPDQITYTLNAAWSQRHFTLSGTESIHFRNNGGGTLRAVWIRHWPNGWRPVGSSVRSGGCSRPLATLKVTGGGKLGRRNAGCTAYRVDLRHPVKPGARGAVQVAFRVRVPRGDDRFARTGPYSNIGNAIPLLAVHDANGWHLDRYSSTGESFYSLSAGWNVTLRMPKGIRAATTGKVVRTRRGALVIQARNARDFALATGPFRVITGRAGSILVRVSAPRSMPIGRVRDALSLAQGALRAYERDYGPYGAPELDVVLGTFAAFGGMEYPQLVLTLPAYGPVRHEIAHQWFYGIVGDDQRHEPWLDESFASWVEHDLSGFPDCPQPPVPTVPGLFLDSTMNVFDRHPQRYGQVVYNGGSCALEVLAHDLGHATFRNMLKTYVADHRAGVTTKADFLAAVTAAAPPGFDVNSWARGVRLRAP
jgi:hypothetical protein